MSREPGDSGCAVILIVGVDDDGQFRVRLRERATGDGPDFLDGRMGQAHADDASPRGPRRSKEKDLHPQVYFRLNVISTLTRTGTGLPSFWPGSKTHCFIALTASSSRP